MGRRTVIWLGAMHTLLLPWPLISDNEKEAYSKAQVRQ